MTNVFFKKRRVHWRLRGSSLICKAVSAGIIPSDAELNASMQVKEIPDNVKEFYDKMEPFKGKFADVSDKDDSKYQQNVESNSKLIIEYGKNMFKKVFSHVNNNDVDKMFEVSVIGEKTQPNTTALPKIASLFSRGYTAGFWDAVMIRIQRQRDLQQQVSDTIGMSIEDFTEAQDSLRRISTGYSINAKTTNSLTYIKGNTPEQKREDQAAFKNWVKGQSNHFCDIIRLNLQDLPYSYCPAELIAFEKDQNNPVKKRAVLNKLDQLKKEAYDHVKSELKKNSSTKVDIQKWLQTK